MNVLSEDPGTIRNASTSNLTAGPASGSPMAVVTTRSEPWKAMAPIPVSDATLSLVLPPETLTTLVRAQKREP